MLQALRWRWAFPEIGFTEIRNNDLRALCMGILHFFEVDVNVPQSRGGCEVLPGEPKVIRWLPLEFREYLKILAEALCPESPQKRNDPPARTGGSSTRSEFSLRTSGGGGGNRTPVPRHFGSGFYVCIPSSVISRPARLRRTGFPLGPLPNLLFPFGPVGQKTKGSLLLSSVPASQASPSGRRRHLGGECVVRVRT